MSFEVNPLYSHFRKQMYLTLFKIFVCKFMSGFFLLFDLFYCPCLVLALRLFLPCKIYWGNVSFSSAL